VDLFSPPRRVKARTRDKFRQFKTAWAIIVRAGVQALDAFVHLAARERSKTGVVFWRAAQLAQHAQAVATGSMMSRTTASNGVACSAANARHAVADIHGEAFRLQRLRTNEAVFFSSSTNEHAHG